MNFEPAACQLPDNPKEHTHDGTNFQRTDGPLLDCAKRERTKCQQQAEREYLQSVEDEHKLAVSLKSFAVVGSNQIRSDVRVGHSATPRRLAGQITAPIGAIV